MKAWSIEDCRALRIAELKHHRELYEGLIHTYSVKATRSALGYHANEFDYKYRVLSQENSSPYIQILLNKSSDIDEIVKLLNTCGWYIADAVDIKLTHFHTKKEIDNLTSIKNLNYLMCRARFDIEIEEKFWPNYLYHISPLKNWKSIEEKGLIPKSEGKLIAHNDHIYLYDINNSEMSIEELVLLLHDKNKFIYDKYTAKFKDKYVLLKINMILQPDYFQLFYDPDLIYSYFTLDNISSGSIHLERIININSI
jgi:hypothetical protein